MLQVIETTGEALALAQQLSEMRGLEGFDVGITGAFAEGTQKKASPLQFVLKAKEGYEDKIGTLLILDTIRTFMIMNYHNKYEIMWYDLLAKDEEDYIEFLRTEGMTPNPMSIYNRVVDMTKWVEEGGKVRG